MELSLRLTMTSARPAVLLTRRVPSSIQAKLEAVCDLHVEESALSPDELREKVRGKAGLICVLTDRIDDALLDAAPDLRIVANIAVGYDNIDVSGGGARAAWP